MSTHTRKDRREDIVTLFGVYDIPLKLQPGQLDQAADFGCQDVFAEYFEQYKHHFLVDDESFGDGDDWPERFMSLAKRQYVEGLTDEEHIDVRLAHVSELPKFFRNERIKGAADKPVMYLTDRKFHFIPDTTEAIVEYYKYPEMLSEGVDDEATDTMPLVLEPLIARAGFECALKMQVDEKDALELTKEEYKSTVQGLERLFAEKFIQDTKNPLEEERT